MIIEKKQPHTKLHKKIPMETMDITTKKHRYNKLNQNVLNFVLNHDDPYYNLGKTLFGVTEIHFNNSKPFLFSTCSEHFYCFCFFFFTSLRFGMHLRYSYM